MRARSSAQNLVVEDARAAADTARTCPLSSSGILLESTDHTLLVNYTNNVESHNSNNSCCWSHGSGDFYQNANQHNHTKGEERRLPQGFAIFPVDVLKGRRVKIYALVSRYTMSKVRSLPREIERPTIEIAKKKKTER